MAQVEDEITVPRLTLPVFAAPTASAGPSPNALPAPNPVAGTGPSSRPSGDRPPGPDAPWLVQLELTTREFALFRGSELTRGAVAWREGMPEWRPLTTIDQERQWQSMSPDSAPPTAAAVSEPPRRAPRFWMGEFGPQRWPHSIFAVALVALAVLVLMVWWGPVQTARDAALRAELAVARLAPIVERALAALEARAAEAASRAAPLPAGGSPARAVASSSAAPHAPPSAAPAPASASAVSVPAPPLASSKFQATPVDRAQLARALSAAVARTSSCSSGASGSLRAIVTFGPNGVVRAVSLGRAPDGVDRSCVSKVLSSARGRPYEGEPVTIKRVIKF